MRRLAFLGLALSLSLGLASPSHAATQTTVTGHLRDSSCFLSGGAQGSGHHDCAMQCAKAGAPVILEQNETHKLFVLLPAKDKQPLPDQIINKMEEQVTVTGSEYSKGGMSFLSVEAVK